MTTPRNYRQPKHCKPGFLILVWLLFLYSCSDGSKQESQTAQSSGAASQSDQPIKTIEWTDLIPEDDLEALLNPPEYVYDIEDGSAEDELESQLQNSGGDDTRYQQALSSTRVIPEFNNQRVRIPGFIVPLEFNDEQVITTFFLVPYFGACIHEPPPPPNQIIYAEYEPGMKLETLYDPFWIEGTLTTSIVQNDMAKAAYAIDVSDISIYDE